MAWDDDFELKPAHLKEWVEGSGIDPEIAARNIISMDGEAVIDTLCGDRLEAASGHGQQYATRPVAKLINRYEQAAEGGWWCSPLITNDSWDTSSTWGCFKPDRPRLNEEGKTIKYEHPLDQQCGVFWLRNKSDSFWPYVLSKPGAFTIVITEGVVGDLAEDPTMAIADTKKDLRELSKDGYDLLYFEPKGYLYVDGNGDSKGFGKKSEGGMIADLPNETSLTENDVLIGV
jgi:hypothetical protein